MKFALPKYSKKKWMMIGGVAVAAVGLWWLKKRKLEQLQADSTPAESPKSSCIEIATKINKGRSYRVGAMSQAEVNACKKPGGVVRWSGTGRTRKQVCMCE